MLFGKRRLKTMNRHLLILLHTSGMSSVIGMLTLALLAFYKIFTQGFFFAIEPNSYILTLELFCSVYAFAYFLGMWVKIAERLNTPK